MDTIILMCNAIAYLIVIIIVVNFYYY